MYIHINDQTTIAQIQKAFTDFYPFLAIHFYKDSHTKYQQSSEKDTINLALNISAIKKTHTDGIIEILPFRKVAEVEHEFLDKFDLSVQILRKEKETWIQTSSEDDFTLAELNMLSRNSSDDYILEEEDIDPGEEKAEKLL